MGEWGNSRWWEAKGETEGAEGGTDGVMEGEEKQAWREGKEEQGVKMDGGEEIGCLVLIAWAKSIVAE